MTPSPEQAGGPDDAGQAEGPQQPFTVVSRMRARRRDEAHRVATPLELFFDLSFAAAVAQAGSSWCTRCHRYRSGGAAAGGQWRHDRHRQR